MLATGAAVAWTAVAGCLTDPSSGGPPYETHEIDDGPVYGPGLEDEVEMEFYAALVADESEAAAFDLDRTVRAADREFVADTDFGEQYLAVVQVSGINSSMEFAVADVAESDVNCTVVASLEDREPHSEDRVITTLLVRVTRTRDSIPGRVSVELSIGDRHETFSGERAASSTE